MSIVRFAIIVLIISAITASSAFAQSDKPQVLDESHQLQFINALSEISMPARAYQQIIGFYQQLLAQQQASPALERPKATDGK